MHPNRHPLLHMVPAILALALVAGCVTGNTPEEKFHSRMRAKAVPPSEFLPNHELLAKQANHFPFHYFYLKENVSAYKYVHIAEININYIRKAKGWDKFEAKLIEKTGRGAADLCAFTRAAYEQAFEKMADEAKDGSCLEVTDRTDLPDTLIVEPAFIAIAPTKAELNYIGTAASFFVFGTDIVANLLSAGSVTMECIVRDAKTREIVAMYSDTETNPNAVLAVSNFSRTASTRINVKEIARMTAEVLSAKDYRTVKRKFPFKLISKIKDAELDKKPAKK